LRPTVITARRRPAARRGDAGRRTARRRRRVTTRASVRSSLLHDRVSAALARSWRQRAFREPYRARRWRLRGQVRTGRVRSPVDITDSEPREARRARCYGPAASAQTSFRPSLAREVSHQARSPTRPRGPDQEMLPGPHERLPNASVKVVTPIAACIPAVAVMWLPGEQHRRTCISSAKPKLLDLDVGGRLDGSARASVGGTLTEARLRLRPEFAGLSCRSGRQDLNLRPPGRQPESSGSVRCDSAVHGGVERCSVALSCASLRSPGRPPAIATRRCRVTSGRMSLTLGCRGR
jgi:hypothetical protein